jgi:hypothetical protein
VKERSLPALHDKAKERLPASVESLNPVVLVMTSKAFPNHVKRSRVVIVMTVNGWIAADVARLTFDLSASHGGL